ncbi:hypothetical protein TNCV_3608551 [Trichonephila clavipes]|nr:hypothetical protein TNCV_3608551 [Trichonephila clavipes]
MLLHLLKAWTPMESYKSNVQCLLCNKRHWVLMCPECPSNKMRVKTPDLKQKQDVSLSNHCAAEVLLHKLISRQEAKHEEFELLLILDPNDHTY